MSELEQKKVSDHTELVEQEQAADSGGESSGGEGDESEEANIDDMPRLIDSTPTGSDEEDDNVIEPPSGRSGSGESSGDSDDEKAAVGVPVTADHTFDLSGIAPNDRPPSMVVSLQPDGARRVMDQRDGLVAQRKGRP